TYEFAFKNFSDFFSNFGFSREISLSQFGCIRYRKRRLIFSFLGPDGDCLARQECDKRMHNVSMFGVGAYGAAVFPDYLTNILEPYPPFVIYFDFFFLNNLEQYIVYVIDVEGQIRTLLFQPFNHEQQADRG